MPSMLKSTALNLMQLAAPKLSSMLSSTALNPTVMAKLELSTLGLAFQTDHSPVRPVQ